MLPSSSAKEDGGLARLWSSEPLPAGTYLPEVASCASALAILAAGIHLFCYWRVGSGIIRLLAACFIVNEFRAFSVMPHLTTCGVESMALPCCLSSIWPSGWSWTS